MALQELFGACQAHWLALHPLPDLTAAFALPDPVERMRVVLHGYYAWFRETESMSEKVDRDRGAVAALDAVLAQTADVALGQLADVLAGAFKDRGRVAVRRRALIGLALEFWTWRRLSRQGLDDDAAAALMAQAVVCAPSGH